MDPRSSSHDVPMVGSETPITPTQANTEAASGSSTPVMASPLRSLAPVETTVNRRRRGRPSRLDSVADGTIVLALPSLNSREYYESIQRRPRIVKKKENPNGKDGDSNAHHIVHVNIGEDIMSKLISCCQETSQAFYIVSAFGDISSATIRPPSSETLVQYEGQYEIISLNGVFLPSEADENVVENKVRVQLGGTENRGPTGTVAGSLIAGSPVTIILVKYTPAQKANKQPIDELTNGLLTSGVNDEEASGSCIPGQEPNEQTMEDISNVAPISADDISAVPDSTIPGQQKLDEHTTEHVTGDMPTGGDDISAAVHESFNPEQQLNEHSTDYVMNDVYPTEVDLLKNYGTSEWDRGFPGF